MRRDSVELTPIDDEKRLFVSSRIDDWTGIERHSITVVVDLEGTLDAGIPCGNGTLLYLYFPFEDASVPELLSRLLGELRSEEWLVRAAEEIGNVQWGGLAEAVRGTLVLGILRRHRGGAT